MLFRLVECVGIVGGGYCLIVSDGRGIRGAQGIKFSAEVVIRGQVGSVGE